MNLQIYKEKDLPWKELQQLGLADKGKQLLLNESDKRALLSGRRTSMQHLQDIGDEQLRIPNIDVKISLEKSPDGKLQLLAHPIRKYPERPIELEESEAASLVSGSTELIYKKVEREKIKDVMFEYDPETREFIKTDPAGITIPDKINGIELTENQRERYREGKQIEMADGTNLRYTGVDSDPFRSDKLLIIASILIDGGMTYLAYQGLKALNGMINRHPNASSESPEYKRTKEEMNAANEQKSIDRKVDTGQEHSYTRSGRSR